MEKCSKKCVTLKEISDFDQKPYLGNYQTVNNRYYGSIRISLVKYEDEPHLYRNPIGTDYIGDKLHYLGGYTFGYDHFPMDRIIFEPDSSGTIIAFNTYWNGLRKGGLYRKN